MPPRRTRCPRKAQRLTKLKSPQKLEAKKLPLQQQLSLKANSSTRISLFLPSKELSSVEPPSACPHAFLSPEAPPLWPASFSAPRPLLGVLNLSPPIGGGHASSLVNVTGGCFLHPLEKSRGDVVEAPQNNGECSSSSFLVFGGKPRRSRTIPQGMSALGARGLWVVVREVA